MEMVATMIQVDMRVWLMDLMVLRLIYPNIVLMI